MIEAAIKAINEIPCSMSNYLTRAEAEAAMDFKRKAIAAIKQLAVAETRRNAPDDTRLVSGVSSEPIFSEPQPG